MFNSLEYNYVIKSILTLYSHNFSVYNSKLKTIGHREVLHVHVKRFIVCAKSYIANDSFIGSLIHVIKMTLLSLREVFKCLSIGNNHLSFYSNKLI